MAISNQAKATLIQQINSSVTLSICLNAGVCVVAAKSCTLGTFSVKITLNVLLYTHQKGKGSSGAFPCSCLSTSINRAGEQRGNRKRQSPGEKHPVARVCQEGLLPAVCGIKQTESHTRA